MDKTVRGVREGRGIVPIDHRYLANSFKRTERGPVGCVRRAFCHTEIINNESNGDFVGPVYGNGKFLWMINEPDGIRIVIMESLSKRVSFDYSAEGVDRPEPVISLHFLNGMFVGLTSTSTYYTSEDGINWTCRQSDAYIKRIMFANGVYVGLGSRSGVGPVKVFYCRGGIEESSRGEFSWVETSIYGGFQIEAANEFVVLGHNGEGTEHTHHSEDGVFWESIRTESPLTGHLGYFKDRFVDISRDGHIQTSLDGKSWDGRFSSSIDGLRTIRQSGTYVSPNNVYGFTDGLILTLALPSNLGDDSRIFVTEDLNEWVLVETHKPEGSWSNICYGNGMIVGSCEVDNGIWICVTNNLLFHGEDDLIVGTRVVTEEIKSMLDVPQPSPTYSKTITIYPVDWDGTETTVVVEGIKQDVDSQLITVFPRHYPESNVEACAGIRCVNQGEGTLNIRATQGVPSETVYIVVTWTDLTPSEEG